MRALDFFRHLVREQKRGSPAGIASVCSANPLVLEAALLQAAEDGAPVLVESTVNQVNQFGGYAGMRPADFRRLVESVAGSRGFPRDHVLLGGDHLGPYPWRAEPASTAMAKAGDLVAGCVRAGYVKIHLDASMSLGGDETGPGRGVDPRLVARRQAELAERAEAVFQDLLRETPQASPPVYVIGTEVPPPGGVPSGESVVPVTRVEDFLETVELSREAFQGKGLDEAWLRVCAVVAQPGVEFADREIHDYDPAKAMDLCRAARETESLVLEGHSTDYQAPAALRSLVQDGVAILKVGPALTFALRECLFCLESIEKELFAGRPGVSLSRLSEALEKAMAEYPSHWKAFYSGTEAEMRLSRKYSFSDRIRYYWGFPGVKAAVETLLGNLGSKPLPLPVISQFLPLRYREIREGRCAADSRSILLESVRFVLREYSAAAGWPR